MSNQLVNVLVIITTEFVHYGGLTTSVMNIYKAIDKSNLHFDFASTNDLIDAELTGELAKNGSNYYFLGDRKRHVFRYISNLNALLKMNTYDVIHVNSNSSTAAVELYIAWKNSVSKRIVHNHSSKCNHRILHTVLLPLYRRLYTQAVACSREAGDWIFKDSTYTVVNNCIDVEKYRFSYENRTVIRSELGIKEDTVVLGHLGKIYKPKNHDFIVRVFKEYHEKNPNSLLMLVGDGVLRNEVTKKVYDLGIGETVLFIGMKRETWKYLSAMDIFVFPSLWEGMPLSLLEAQASGLNCFISDRIDNGVILTDGIEMLSLDTDIEIWVRKILKCDVCDRVNKSKTYSIQIKNKGYDSSCSARMLRDLYVE